MTENEDNRKGSTPDPFDKYLEELDIKDVHKVALAQFLDKLDLTPTRKDTLFDVGARLIDVHGLTGADACATIARMLRGRR